MKSSFSRAVLTASGLAVAISLASSLGQLAHAEQSSSAGNSSSGHGEAGRHGLTPPETKEKSSCLGSSRGSCAPGEGHESQDSSGEEGHLSLSSSGSSSGSSGGHRMHAGFLVYNFAECVHKVGVANGLDPIVANWKSGPQKASAEEFCARIFDRPVAHERSIEGGSQDPLASK